MPSQQSIPATDVLLAKRHVENDRTYEEPFIRDPFPEVYSTTDEASVVSMYLTDIETYVQERAISFICSYADIDTEFDAYIETLKSMQVEELLKVRQAQYDRYVNALN